MVGGVIDRYIDAILDARALRRERKLATLERQRAGIVPQRNGRRRVLELRQRWCGMNGERQNKERGKYGLQNHEEINDGDGRSVRERILFQMCEWNNVVTAKQRIAPRR
jgi:hypothetical protein